MLHIIVEMYTEGLITADECVNMLLVEFGTDTMWLQVALDDLPQSKLPDDLLIPLLRVLSRL